MIPKDPPIAGTVLRYSYLWRREAEQGRDEGVKDRPVALLLSRVPEEGSCIVLPITHSAPDDPQNAVELPDAERARLGLDAERCWIVLTELNVFTGPAPICGRSRAGNLQQSSMAPSRGRSSGRCSIGFRRSSAPEALGRSTARREGALRLESRQSPAAP